MGRSWTLPWVQTTCALDLNMFSTLDSSGRSWRRHCDHVKLSLSLPAPVAWQALFHLFVIVVKEGIIYINQNAGPDGFKSNLGSLSLSYLLGLSDFSKHFQRSLLSTCATNKPLTSFGAGQIQTHSRISMQSSNIQCIEKKSSMLKELWNKRR